MKGISHFMSGAAVATFFPVTMQAAAEGNPLYFVLGGACGILPDTLDFKFYRFFYRHDVYIEPDPRTADPQQIAEQIAEAVGKAAQSKKMVRVKLSTIRMGADYWQQYSVKFDSEKQEVYVKFGPVVNTGQVPVPGTTPEKPRVGRAKLPCPMNITYDATSNVDIFDGPTFGFEQDKRGGVVFHFLPWHREWTHSLTMGLFLALLALPFLGWQAFALITVCYGVHVIEDQMGFMGSNLLFPFTKQRTQGMLIMRSGDSLPNFLAVWISCLLIFWNMYRSYLVRAPVVRYSMSFFQLMLWGAIVPVGGFWVVMRLLTREKKGAQAEREEISTDEWDEMATV